jgi:RNA polymerase sporulation-specific sigma factor
LRDLEKDLPPQKHAEFEDLADVDIVQQAQSGAEEAAEYLLYKYRNLVRNKVRSYFLVGAEKEDLLQVGMIALSAR